MKILLIEDGQQTLHLKKNLESHCFVVDATANKKAGKSLACVSEYDLILVQSETPEADVLDWYGALGRAGRRSPILIVSDVHDPVKKAHALNAGADDYVTKPFVFDELLARIRALLRRPQQIQESVMRVAHVMLDCHRHHVRVAGELVNFTRKEFMLLQYLMRHRGIVLSRGQIMEHVWDMNGDPFSNTIESHIRNIRKKIDIKNQPKLIHTIPGRGYMMDARANAFFV